MGDMLSQDEINALLGGLTDSDSNSEENNNAETTVQNEGNTDLNIENTTSSEGGNVPNIENTPPNELDTAPNIENTTSNSESITQNQEPPKNIDENIDNILTPEQKDILGEIGNISMGTSATTLYALLGNKVTIDTPNVKVKTWRELEKSYSRPCVGIRVGYKEGLVGSNILILKQTDVKIISNLMMGGDGNVTDEGELTEIDLSAIGEAMNQMVGSSSTSLSSMIKMKIDIDTPHAFLLDFKENKSSEATGFDPDEILVCISFKMQIGNLIDSEIMQILPKDFAINMVETLKSDMFVENEQSKATNKEEIKETPPSIQQMSTKENNRKPMQEQQNRPTSSTTKTQQDINVKPATFQNFETSGEIQKKENIDIIMDVPLEVTVELGRTYKKIRDILEFSPGTIVELNKLAGEPIDILVNGKFIAKGEVVVIDENFGIRITDIMSAENRI